MTNYLKKTITFMSEIDLSKEYSFGNKFISAIGVKTSKCWKFW